MPTGYNIIWDLQNENMLLRARNEELEEENDKLCEELAEKTTTRGEDLVTLIFTSICFGIIWIVLQATYWILPNV